MPTKSKSADDLEVIPVVPIFHGTREFPLFAGLHVKTTLELDPDPAVNAKLVQQLIDDGKVMKVTKETAEAAPEEVAAIVAEQPPA